VLGDTEDGSKATSGVQSLVERDASQVLDERPVSLLQRHPREPVRTHDSII
jgi:hypothetical protein